MKKPSDRVEILGPRIERLAARDRARLVTMRQAAGAVDVRITVHARPSGRDASWQPIKSATRKYTAHAGINAELLAIGAQPIAGTDFVAPEAILEFYESLEIPASRRRAQ